MSRDEVQATRYRCDAANCDVVYYRETDELSPGYHGTVTREDKDGGHGGPWFACRPDHIKAAVLAAVSRRD